MDLEMTGLDAVRDRILEVAAVATGWELVEVARCEAVVKVGRKLMVGRMRGKFWSMNDGARKALMEQNAEKGVGVREVEDGLIAFLGENFDLKKPVILAGNSIHQDRRFIEREWPRFNKYLHYRMLDVSAWKVYFEGARGKKFVKKEAHRAADDIAGSIEELRWYITMIC
jgi:oligoribonuclease